MKMSSNVILLTGGTSGIGIELATQLLKLNNVVIVTGRDQGKLDTVKKMLPEIHTIQSDVSNPHEIVKLYETVTSEFPNLNFLINNAGIMRTINFHNNDIDLTDINLEIETNLTGPIRMVKQFLPHLKKQNNAAILNVTSLLAFVPLPLSPVYCASKAGSHSFTQSLRVQLKNTNVKVFELAPPVTKTPILGVLGGHDTMSSMDVSKMVGITIKGLENDREEIRPGSSNLFKIMSRIAPNFMLKQTSRSTITMLSRDQN